MNTQDEDRDLREAFASQRREEEKRVTAFQRILTLSPTQSQGRGGTAVALVATFLVAIGLVVVLQRSGSVAQPEPAMQLAEWIAPTAFLLRTPGHDFVSTLPTFARTVPALDPPAKQERSSTP